MLVEVRPAGFRRDRDVIRQIRFAVFVEEQRVPLEVELDDRDPQCLHALAYVGGSPVGTGRLDLDKGGRIGRVAVLAPYRRAGVGSAMMAHFHRVAVERGLASVWCHAQRAAVPFYERLGYRVSGEPFEEAGIEHLTMMKALTHPAIPAVSPSPTIEAPAAEGGRAPEDRAGIDLARPK